MSDWRDETDPVKRQEVILNNIILDQKAEMERTSREFQSNFNVMIASPHGEPALTHEELRKSIIRTIKEKDQEAKTYGLALVGYSVEVSEY